MLLRGSTKIKKNVNHMIVNYDLANVREFMSSTRPQKNGKIIFATH